MSSMPLSPVEPDSIHIASMMSTMPKGTVAIGGTRRACISQAASSSEARNRPLLGNSNCPASVGVNDSTETAKAGIR